MENHPIDIGIGDLILMNAQAGPLQGTPPHAMEVWDEEQATPMTGDTPPLEQLENFNNWLWNGTPSPQIKPKSPMHISSPELTPEITAGPKPVPKLKRKLSLPDGEIPKKKALINLDGMELVHAIRKDILEVQKSAPHATAVLCPLHGAMLSNEITKAMQFIRATMYTRKIEEIAENLRGAMAVCEAVPVYLDCYDVHVWSTALSGIVVKYGL